MKRALTLSMALALALPLAAGDEKKTAPEAAPATATQPQPAAPQQDSPMVRAAKRSNRLGKKSTSRVITNETLKDSKGHITTTKVQPELNTSPVELTPAQLEEKMAASRKAEEARARVIGAEAEKKAAEEKKRRTAEAAASAEEGIYDNLEDDPSAAGQPTEEAPAQKPPRH